MRIYHTTTEPAFHNILATGYIRPHGKGRKIGESGKSFAVDTLAGDYNFVFFSLRRYQPTFSENGKNDNTFGFMFDLDTLLENYTCYVGIDLMTKYDALLDVCIKEAAKDMKRKPVNSDSLAKFFEKHNISDIQMQQSIIEAEANPENDILNNIQDGIYTTEAQKAIDLFRKKVATLQKKNRFKYEDATPAFVDTEATELLIKSPVNIKYRTGIVEPTSHFLFKQSCRKGSKETVSKVKTQFTSERAKEVVSKGIATKRKRAAWRLERVRELRNEKSDTGKSLTSTQIAEIINSEILDVFRSDIESNPRYTTEKAKQTALEKLKITPRTILKDFQTLNKEKGDI